MTMSRIGSSGRTSGAPARDTFSPCPSTFHCVSLISLSILFTVNHIHCHGQQKSFEPRGGRQTNKTSQQPVGCGVILGAVGAQPNICLTLSKKPFERGWTSSPHSTSNTSGNTLVRG